ncbi:amidohydrolase family protein [Kribbella sp. CA-245084]|uniref:amidohydrolase family protein n=1 Tax=Kribbella sp. CA-245084 TaxID=3239940 RepID=UPI003D92A947
MPVVDVHCHNFNADDLPVRGFVRHVGLHDSLVSPAVAALIDTIVQKGAPGYTDEKPQLDALLGRSTFGDGLEGLEPVQKVVEPLDQLRAEVDAELADLLQRNPALVRSAAEDLAGQEVDQGEGLFDITRAVRRAVTWAKLFTKSRLGLTGVLMSTYPDVDLFTPMLVDLGTALGDKAKTSVREQVILQEQISRLSMLGKLPWQTRARIHPFVGFDPRHEVRARQAHDIDTPLAVVKDAIRRFGFVGVKVYPPMGFRPLKNVAVGDVTAEEAATLNEVLDEFYKWCVEEHVPITAHCNNSQYASEIYKNAGLAGPGGWIDVLEKYDSLHLDLDLGHFGGAHAVEQPDAWIWQIANAAARFDHLYADVGDHKTHDRALSGPYLDRLHDMFNRPATKVMRDRLMYGTDWFMLAIYPDWDRFFTTYRDLYRDKLGAGPTNDFLGTNALHFLGFGDPTNQNNRRLWEWYAKYAADHTPAWLASPVPATP